MAVQSETLPSGKTIIRHFDDNGQLSGETQSYGALDIACSMKFSDGVKVEELYFVKKRLVSRKRYNQATVQYPDMPVPDDSLTDVGGELAKLARQERKQRSEAAKIHHPDPKRAGEKDSFCQSIMDQGRCEDATTWIESSSHTLGEYNHATSRAIVEKLVRAGSKRIRACQIDTYDDGLENTGHLVVELPDAAAARRKIFREMEKLVRKQGTFTDFDDGQRFAYLHLD